MAPAWDNPAGRQEFRATCHGRASERSHAFFIVRSLLGSNLIAEARIKQAEALPLTEMQLGLLIDAASRDWREVEPAIFGTLLERALDKKQRHKLGAHYTPRAYVERLVVPTIIDPLRNDWRDVQAAAVALAAQGREDEARDTVRAFHARLCEIRVLDPACGSGNFLYVALELMKRLEGEVTALLADLGEDQGALSLAGHTVDPHQFIGIELNP